jgi:hypothetical protein
MKVLIAIILLISIVVNGLTSYHLFRATDYDLSALLTITSYLSLVMGIYVVTMGKRRKLVS